MNNKFDFHIHSTFSDGTDSIPAILEKLQEAQIHTFSITDHDTIKGSELMASIVPSDIRYIRGVEFSCTTHYKKCHILGYGYCPEDPLLLDALELVRQLRQEKLVRRIAFLKTEFGIHLTKEELAWLNAQTSPGKPSFGQILVKRGLAPDIRTAIKTYINPCKDVNDRIDADVAVKAVLHAGGIPVWAHPLGGEGERRLTKEEFELQLQKLLASSIQGLECFYSRYTQEEIQFLLEQANLHHLLISAGSDYHGSNKSDISLGKLNAENLIVDFHNITLNNVVTSV